MIPGVQNLPVKVATSDGRNLTFFESPEAVLPNGKRYRIEVPFTTDQASTPRLSWWLIPPFGLPNNNYAPGSWFHDAAYQLKLLALRPDGRWQRVSTDEYWDDQLILHLMKAHGVKWLTRWTIYAALRWFGWAAFKSDRKAASRRLKGVSLC